MNSMKRLLTLILAVLAASIAAGASAQLGPIHLRFVYDSDTTPNSWKPATPTVAIGAIQDARDLENPMLIGECQAVGPDATPVVSQSPVSDFVAEALHVSLGKWKVDVSPEAEHVLRCEVLHFWVVEKSRFAANVRFRFTLEDRNGGLIWQGEVANDDSTWGRTCNEANYVQVLSVATQRAIVGLFDNKDFRAVLMQKAN